VTELDAVRQKISIVSDAAQTGNMTTCAILAQHLKIVVVLNVRAPIRSDPRVGERWAVEDFPADLSTFGKSFLFYKSTRIERVSAVASPTCDSATH
jgi:hypothetical protein